MHEDDFRKILVFDIDTILLRERIGSSYTNAYTKIKRFFCSRGFMWIQGSGYESIVPIQKPEIIEMYKELLRIYPYLDGCIRDVRFADIISPFYNLTDVHLDDNSSPTLDDAVKKSSRSSHDDYDFDF